jgi:hypothetical protein
VNQRLVHHWPCILLALALIVGAATTASAYTRSTASPPTDADMVLINGRAATVGIRILNLTPYEIVEDTTANTAKGSTDISRKTHKSMMFAPVGWPINLPALPGGWGPQDPLTGASTFNPDSPNNTTHPYSFAVAWDDQAGYVTNSTMGWTIKGVYTKAHGTQTKDVGLRMWFTRVKPDKPLLGADFKFITSCIVQFVDVIGVALDPLNPIAWLDVFVATKELKDSAFEVANSEETGGDKMYFASYVLPDAGSYVDTHGPGCDPFTAVSTSNSSTDGVSTQWTDAAGDYASTIVVTTHILRGDDVATDNGFGCCGSGPIAMVTVWTSDQWSYGNAASVLSPLTADYDGLRINTLLRLGSQDQRKQRYLQFARLYNSMDAKQLKAYRDAFEKLRKHQRLTGKLKNLLQAIATALEEGSFSMKGKWKP